MVTRRVRAKDSTAALKLARKKYPSMTVKVNWLPNVKANKKGEKQYSVTGHKKKVKSVKKNGVAW